MPAVLKIATASQLPADSFRESFLDTGTPVLIDGLNDAWPAFTRWTPEFFRATAGDLPVLVRRYHAAPKGGFEKVSMSLGDYLDYWETLDTSKGRPDNNLYLAEWNFVRTCPDFAQDFTVPEHFALDWIERLPPNVRFGRMWLFFGHPFAHTPVHTDTFSTSAWLAMISGHKTIRFLPPECEDAIFAGMDMFDPAVEKKLLDNGYPLAECRIAPGQMLFIPARWFHHVRNDDKNVLLTANFADSANLLRFLSEFESRLLEPILELRRVRNEFCQNIGTPRNDSKATALLQEQLAWADEVDSDIQVYRALLKKAQGG